MATGGLSGYYNNGQWQAPKANAQFSAIQNGANNNSLISQLFGGKTTPVSQTPPATAAAANVKSVNAPATTSKSASLTTTPPPPVQQTPAAPGPSYSAGGHAVIPTNADGTYSPIATQTTPSSTGTTETQTPAPTNQPGTTSYPGIVGSLSGFNPFNNPQVSGAYKNAQQAQSELERLKNEEATGIKNAALSPSPIGDITGRQAALSNYYGQRENAASQALAGYSTLFQGGLTGTGQQESALNSAAGFAKPEFQPEYGGYYSPVSGGAVTPTPQQYTIKSGDTFYGLAGGDQSKIAAIEAANPGIDPNNLQPGQTINLPAQGGQYGTGPAAGANVQLIKDLTKQVGSMSSARSAVNSVVQNNLNPFLQANNVNPSDVNAVNGFIQTVARNTSSPQYKELSNLLTDIAQSYAPVFVAQGQDPSVWTSQTTQGLLDSTQKGQSIQQVIAGLDAQAQSKIAGYQDTINKLQTGQNTNPPAQNSGPQTTQPTTQSNAQPNPPGWF